MRKILFCLIFMTSVAALGERREVHILSVNDMHANIDAMPRLAAIADSLRALYPSLLVLSAGDNRTGNPLNDMYAPSGYPMVALMNQIGFDASAVGNHEFDMHSLPKLIGLSNFRYLCANIDAADSTGLNTRPYQVFDVDGLRVGIIGTVQVNRYGHPDTHPDNLHGVFFDDPVETVRCHEWLSRECDVTILLSHAGYRCDTLTASLCPWLDLIVGGHTHKQLKADSVAYVSPSDAAAPIPGTPSPGRKILITQNTHKLYHATHITLTVDSGRVTSARSEYIDVHAFSRQNSVVAQMVNSFSDDNTFRRVLAHAATPFETPYEIGCMVCDAFMDATGADVAIQNFRGVRMSSMEAGEITVRDVLTIDPFGNAAYVLTLNGDELYDMVRRYSRMEVCHFPHLGGLHADIILNHDDSQKIDSIRLTHPDGTPLDPTRTYRVVTNSYVSAACRSYGIKNMERLNRLTADIIMRFLEHRGTVDYQGVKRIDFNPGI